MSLILIKVSPEMQERLRSAATASLTGLSRTLAQKLQIDQKYINAFATLSLGVWATQAQVEEQRKSLAKQYHPDKNPVNAQRMTEINAAANLAAANLLIDEYFINSPQGIS